MRRAAACGVIVMALFAIALTRSASADVPAETPVAAATASVAPTVITTPLQVRPSAPLVLEPAPTGPGFGWKILALLVAAGCGVWIWKKRGPSSIDKRVPELRIIGRTSAGSRCELLLIELEGQRMLLGVTPQSIQNLYIIADAPSEQPNVEVKENTPATKRTMKNAPQGADGFEGQARGLLGNGERL